MNLNIENQLYHIISCSNSTQSLIHILLAISGGQDSMYLIYIIEKLKKHIILENIVLDVAYIYVDHQWKNYSYKQIEHIINYVRSLNRNIDIYQNKKNTFSEHECRIKRYHIIFQHAIKHKYTLILTGHNKTDKIETFFQGLLRGSGMDGTTSLTLQSINNRNFHLLRPLLNIAREKIYWKCKKNFLPIWSDTTNYIYSIHRNRLRNEIIPYMKKYLHQNIENNIEHLLKNYYYDNEYIKQNTIKTYLKVRHKKYISINFRKLQKQNIALQVRIIQLFLYHNINIEINYNKLTRLIRIMNQKSNKLLEKIEYKSLQINFHNEWLYITLKNNI
uniref:tRNA(Ile)-lysidine synthase, chloroplastic n=1 Tax=Digenea simplex TaxID=945030 RepID=A0A1Z1MUR7_DIGSM|nr:tRNA Ile-lysidine synthetase [Digenea simplex]ARW69475.1 tRNA Ile-lysidine synthetase [Digenea simplex]